MQHFDANSDGRITREEFLETWLISKRFELVLLCKKHSRRSGITVMGSGVFFVRASFQKKENYQWVSASIDSALAESSF